MIRIELLPASFGDCILVEYGDPKSTRRILIDAGLASTFRKALKPRLRSIAEGEGGAVPLELLVITHIDRDHICGILPLLRADPPLVVPNDVWFNGRHHLEDDALGAKEGEILSDLLIKKKLPWNTAFGPSSTRAVVVPAHGEIPKKSLQGGATLTLLSPYRENLEALAAEWDDSLGHWDEEPEEMSTGGKEVAAERDDVLGKRLPLQSIDIDVVRDLADEPFVEDTKKPNGSSIAFLFEYDGKRVLFGADAHPTPVLRSLSRMSSGPISLDAFKLSHHGSMNNLSPDLLAKVTCSHFLVSSDGSAYGHPHPETLAWVVTASPKRKTLCFNYVSPYTTVWDEEQTRKEFQYLVAYPRPGAAGYLLPL
jgi:beta-lactamase superfamily II metal-dependent hydrolase